MFRPTPRHAANSLGAGYLALGLVGFVVTGVNGFTTRTGPTVLGFAVNPLLNFVHLVVGVALLVAAGLGDDAARQTTAVLGGVFLVLGLLGLALVGTEANVLALNRVDNALHLLTGAAAWSVTVWHRFPRRRRSGRTLPGDRHPWTAGTTRRGDPR